jgi:soluble lytic murein transglycosylase-like protein
LTSLPRLWALLSLAAFALFAAPQQSPSPSPPKPPATAPLAPTLNPEHALEEALKQQRASLEKQRQAIHRQLAEKIEKNEAFSAPVEQFIAPLTTPPSRLFAALEAPAQPADCPALDIDKVSKLVSFAAQEQSLDPALLKSIIKQESGFKPCAVSMKGAQGLMQLMPGTARELHVTDVFDPAQNVQAGAAYLKQMLERYNGDLRLALVGYNAGPSRADQATTAPYPLETQNYVASILADLGIDQPDSANTQEDLAPPDDAEQQVPVSSGDAKPATNSTSPIRPIVSEEKTKVASPKP